MEAPFYHDDVVGLHSFGQVSAFASYSSKNVALLRQGKAAAQTSPLPGVLQATACVGGPPLLPPSSSTSSLVSSASSSSPPSPPPPPPPPAPPSALSSAASSSSSSSSTSSSPSESAMLRLSSSDMERFIIHHHHRQQQQQQQHHHLHHLHQGGPGLSAPLSPGLHGAVSGAFGRGGGSAAEEEKDNFANGFVRALEELHKQNIRHSAASSSFSSSCSPALVSQLHGSGYEAPSPHQQQQHLLPSYAPLLPQHHAAADVRQGPPSSSSSPAACYADLGGYGPQLGLASTGGGGGLQQGLAGTSAGGLEYGTSALYAHAQSAGHASSLQYLPRSQQQQQQLLLKEEEEETLQTVPDLMHEGGGGGGGPSNASSTSSSSSSSSAAATVSDLVGRGATAPVDMESQEKMKVERKRLRNRIAASKCRKRKLERIARLEEKVAALKANNAQLAGTAGTLREQVDTLKQRVLNHLGRGCRLAIGATQGGTALQAF
ncbi:transcription factor JunB-like [Lethenteron reissneri]|uniref:transcription factor JunB-like n=1 Tax=Lethenteron reissneri TaxID=7753 RepID=UPI002AB61921|nr:transcription factor JunB-like [Lethenteron reissneri]